MRIAKTFFYGVVCTCLCYTPLLSQTSWKTLRQQGANFYTIEDTFSQQNALLLQQFQAELPNHEGQASGKFNAIIKYNRWANHVRPRIVESGGNLNAITTGNARALTTRSTEVQARSGASWQLLSPNRTPNQGGNGRINAIRVHPTQPNTVFACAPAGGLWRSSDGGTLWTNVTDDIGILGCSDVVFAPNDPNTLYLATGDADASSSYSTGVFKSTNGGTTWAPTGLTYLIGQSVVLSRLLIHPTDGSLLVSGSNGIHRSTNGGQSWQQVSTANTREMTFSANNPSIVFATLYTPATGNSILLRSADSGISWNPVSSGLPMSNMERAALAVTPANPNYVYLLVAESTNHGLKGLYRSTDAGLSFTTMSTNLNVLGWDVSGSDSGGQGWYDLALAASPTDANLIVTGGVNIWKSVNGGQSFNISAHWSGDNGTPQVHADIHQLLFNGNTIWAACDGGVFKSPDVGATWQDKSQSLAIAQLYDFGSSPTEPNRILMGLQDNGTNLMTQPGQWSEVLGGDGMQCFFDRANPNNAFASIYQGALFRSSDGGQRFNHLYTLPNGNWVTPWLQDPVQPNTLYAGAKQLFKSTDSGSQWTPISQFSSNAPINAIEVAHSNPQIIYVSKGVYPTQRTPYTPTIYKTTNGGITWTTLTLTNFPANTPIVALHLDITNPQIIYVGLASYSGASVYRSTDGGATWANYSTGLPQVPTNCFVTTRGHADGEIFVGTDIGVYRRGNRLTTWESFSQQLPAVPVSGLEIFYPTSKLRAGTYGRGLWESLLPGYNVPPTVQLTAPTDGHVFTTGTPIAFAATARDLDGTIKKVQFYRQGALVATDSVAPYEFQWNNATIGTYRVYARAIDDSLGTTNTPEITISVVGRYDGALVGVPTPNGLVLTDTVSPILQLKNLGVQPLTSLTIDYQLDNQAIQTFQWTGQLAPQANTTLQFPLLRYGLGRHDFKAYITRVNQVADENHSNDTIQSRFSYYLFNDCADNFEPNNTFATAIPIPLNTLVRSKLAQHGDEDFYRFQTSVLKPSFKINLKNLPADFDFEVYQYNTQSQTIDLLGIAAQPSLRPETFEWNASVDSGTYYVRVYNHYNADSCYTLLVENKELPRYDASIEGFATPRYNVHTLAVVPLIAEEVVDLGIRVKNTGNQPISEIEYVLEPVENGNPSIVLNTTFPYPLMPNDTISLYERLQRNSISPTGRYYAYLKHPRGIVDINPLNDTAFGTYTFPHGIHAYMSMPNINEERIYRPTDTILIHTTAVTALSHVITKVEFYENGNLIATDSSEPYQYRWMRAPIGRHYIQAKAYNDVGYVAYSGGMWHDSYPIPITVAAPLDAGITFVENERHFRVYDSIHPIIRVRNYGLTALNQVTCSYQLDNQPIVTQTFTNLRLATGDSQRFELPFLRLNVGQHRLKTWVHRPNNGTDLYAGNDTITFSFPYNLQNFTTCSTNFGDNDFQLRGTAIPTNQDVRCSPEDRIRYFHFKTTRQKPNFQVILDDFLLNYDLNIYTMDTLTNNVSRMGSSVHTGLTPDTITIEGYAPRTFIISVEPTVRVPDRHLDYCYRLRVNTYAQQPTGPLSGDIGIDSILIPPIVYSTWQNVGVRIRNFDTVAIPANTRLPFTFQSNNNFPMESWVDLTRPLQPGEAVIGTVGQGYLWGSHRVMAYIPFWAGSLNRVRSNDTFRTQFLRRDPTEVRLTAPDDDVLISFGTPITLTASANADVTVTISRIEFYRDSLLIGSVLGSSAQFQWLNAPRGSHLLRAKVIDSRGNGTYSNAVRIYVTQLADAGAVAVEATYGFWVGDTNTPQVRIRNLGANPLTQVRIHSRLDNGIENILNVTGIQLASNEQMSFVINRFQYPVGEHVLTVWTSMPNGVVDLTRQNDTFRYRFDNYNRNVCREFGEPNDDLPFATPILTDTDIRGYSNDTDSGGGDWYLFKTTPNRPQFSIYLDETGLVSDFILYKYDTTIQNWDRLGSWLNFPFHYTSSTDSGTYAFRVTTLTGCYRLRVNTSDKQQTDIGIDSFVIARTEATDPFVTPTLYWHNHTERDLDGLSVVVYVDNQFYSEEQLSGASGNQSASQDLSISGYDYGSHRIRVHLKVPNTARDVNPQNDTAYLGFRYVSLPQVRLIAPPFARTGGQATLEAIATDGSNRISQVSFYRNDTLLGSTSTAPYRFDWNHIPAGTHQLTAKAHNIWHKSQKSAPVTLQALLNAPPVVAWTFAGQIPVQGYAYTDSIPLQAQASDIDGQVVAVQFYKGSTLLATDSTAPYEYKWVNAPAGKHRMTVKAIDNQHKIQTDTNLVLQVRGRFDIGLSYMNDGSRFGSTIAVDTFVPEMTLFNEGTEPLQNFVVSYQLDQQPPVHRNFLMGQQVIFPTATLSRSRLHTLKAWSSLPNGMPDENPLNDTLTQRFGYQECGHNFGLTIKVPFPVRQYMHSTIEDNQEVDSYVFKTTSQNPFFRIWAHHPGLDMRLSLYAKDGSTALIDSRVPVFGEHWMEWRNNTVGQEYILVISSQSSLPDIANCYSIYWEELSTTGVSEAMPYPVGFKLMPNPAQTQVQIVLQEDLDATSSIWVTDLLGRRVWQQTLDHHPANTPITISTEDWVKGIYLVTLRQGGALLTRKLMIE
jgi:photosystem II stability/assembly factor-like uncharacterized protein